MKNGRTMTELVAAIRGGDKDAFTELYELTSQEVYRTARAVLRDEDEALDVQQDTFVYAYQHLDQLNDPEKVRPWLRTIAVNSAKMQLRRKTPVLFTELENDEGQGLPEQADLSADASPELSLERKETSELVNEILGELSDGQRAAVAMYYYEQMSTNEIADALGVNVSTVRAQLFRGRKKIEDAVRALEKKGVNLCGLSPVGFLVALMKKQAPSAQAGEAVLAKTLAKAGLAAGAKTAAAVGAAAVPVGEAVVLQATRPFFSTVVGKLVLGVLCAGVIGGGIAGYNWAKDKLAPKTNPILYVDSDENLNTTMPTIPMEVETTVPAVPETTSPVETEPTPETTSPAETEPAPETTAPAETEPVNSDQCGEHLTWNFRFNELKIEGSGPMYDYDEDANRAPWYEHRGEIFSVRIPEEVSSIGANAFADCAMLNTIWIVNPDCAIGENFADASRVTICGLPGSTAEQYAGENGYRFEPIVEDRDAIRDFLSQEGNEYHAAVAGMQPCGSGYLARIVEILPARVTEEALSQAVQTGTLVVDGREYPFLDNAAEAMETWELNYEEDYFMKDAEVTAGWIYNAPERLLYAVREGDEGYWLSPHLGMPYSHNVVELRTIGWIWLDDDTEVGGLDEEDLTRFDMSFHANNIPQNFWEPWGLRLNEKGDFVFYVVNSNSKVY